MPARRVQVGLLDGIEPNGGRRRSIFPPGGHFALSNPA
jgi:hypothetical protein